MPSLLAALGCRESDGDCPERFRFYAERSWIFLHVLAGGGSILAAKELLLSVSSRLSYIYIIPDTFFGRHEK